MTTEDGASLTSPCRSLWVLVGGALEVPATKKERTTPMTDNVVSIETPWQLDYVRTALDDYRTLVIGSHHVAEVVRWGYHDDDNDLYAMAAVVRLVDGKYAAVEGSCDYTGYSCQAYLDASVHDTEDEALLNGITRDGRAMIERTEAT